MWFFRIVLKEARDNKIKKNCYLPNARFTNVLRMCVNILWMNIQRVNRLSALLALKRTKKRRNIPKKIPLNKQLLNWIIFKYTVMHTLLYVYYTYITIAQQNDWLGLTVLYYTFKCISLVIILNQLHYLLHITANFTRHTQINRGFICKV